MVYDRAADYRRAVDEALFGLGEHRYAALVNLLIQLASRSCPRSRTSGCCPGR